MKKKIFLLALFFSLLSAAAPSALLQAASPHTQEQSAENFSPKQTVEPLSSDLTAPSSQTAEEQKTAPMPSYEGTFYKMIGALFLLITVIFGGLWLVRKISQGRGGLFHHNKSIQILERKPLSPKTMLYVVSVNDKQILIAESQLEVKMLAPLENNLPTDR